jgi:hypothetical protein
MLLSRNSNSKHSKPQSWQPKQGANHRYTLPSRPRHCHLPCQRGKAQCQLPVSFLHSWQEGQAQALSSSLSA